MLKITSISNRLSHDKEALTTKKQSVPGTSKFGLVVMAIGFLFDLVEHTLVIHTAEARIGTFPLSEHLAHLIVIVGMALVLAGVLIQGSHMSARRGRLVPRRKLHAIR
jgi:hypothetical protein